MKIIKLTLPYNDENIYQAVDKIVCFYENVTNGTTGIVTVENPDAIYVKETPEEIIELIKQARRFKMRMIDLLHLQALNVINVGDTLIVKEGDGFERRFKYVSDYGGMFMDEEGYGLEIPYMMNCEFLNYEVELLEEI